MSISVDCAECEKNFDEDIHLPRVLACGHTFCSACLEGIVAGSKQCPLDKRPIEIASVKDISTNYTVLELSKRLPNLLSAIKNNSNREVKTPTQLKRIKKEPNQNIVNTKSPVVITTSNNPAISNETGFDSSANTEHTPLICKKPVKEKRKSHSTATKPKSQNPKQKEKKPETNSWEEEMNQLEANLLSSKILKPHDYFKEYMSCFLDKNSPCPQVTVNLSSPNEDVFQAVSDFYYDARLSRKPEVFERFIIQELLTALQNKAKIITVKSPVNSDRAMLVQAALFAFLSKEKCKNKVIFGTSHFDNSVNGFQQCLVNSKITLNVPYIYVQGQLISSLNKINDKVSIRASITNTNTFTSNSKYSILDDEFSEIELRNYFFIRTSKKMVQSQSLAFDSSSQMTISSNYKSRVALLNTTNFITAPYSDLLGAAIDSKPSLIEHSFVVIDSWTGFKKSLCDLFSFGITMKNLNTFICRFKFAAVDLPNPKSFASECGIILEPILKIRQLLLNLTTETRSILSIMDELVTIAESVDFEKLAHLEILSSAEYIKTDYLSFELGSCLKSFIQSLLQLSRIGFSASDDFVMALCPLKQAIYLKCLNPALGWKTLMKAKPLAIIFLCNSFKEMTSISNSCQISFDAIVSPKQNEFKKSTINFSPNFQGFVFTHLFDVNNGVKVDFTSKSIQNWNDCHSQTIRFIRKFTHKTLTVGGAVVYCPNIEFVDKLQAASQVELSNSLNQYFAHQPIVAKKQCEEHEQSSKNGRSILFVPIKSNFCQTQKIKRHAARLIFFIGVPLENYESPQMTEARNTMFGQSFNAFYYNLASETIGKALKQLMIDEDDFTACLFIDSRYAHKTELRNDLKQHITIDESNSQNSGQSVNMTEEMNKVCYQIKARLKI